jgi:GNAT superfamily N-acetyltransferase
LPAILLGRLAVDERWRGTGLGKFLLIDALYRAYNQSTRNIAAAFVVVDAIDEEASLFYRHFHFMEFPERPDRLFLPMSTIAALFTKN